MTRHALCLIPLIASTLDAAPPKNAVRYADARAAWDACFPDIAPIEFPSAPTEGDLGTHVEVTRTGTHFRVAYDWGGSGIEAVYGGTTIDFDKETCAALWARDSTYDGAFARQTRIGWNKRGAPTDSELAGVAAAPAITDAPAFAMARAWVDHRCIGGSESSLEWAPGAELAGPIAPAQPWRTGAPAKSPDSYWARDQLRAIGARAELYTDPADGDDEVMPPLLDDQLAGVVIPGLAAPTKTLKVGTIEVREAEMPGRNGGRAIALYDRATNRHRWVLLTRGCIQGTTVKWLGAIGARAIGVTASQHSMYGRGDAIVVLDTAAGTAWAVKLPTEVLEGTIERSRAKLAGSTITFGSGNATAAIDLAPALAELAGAGPLSRQK